MELVQKIVRERLGQIGAIQLQRHEHDASKDHDAGIDLADQLVLLTPCPAGRGIESVSMVSVMARCSDKKCSYVCSPSLCEVGTPLPYLDYQTR